MGRDLKERERQCDVRDYAGEEGIDPSYVEPELPHAGCSSTPCGHCKFVKICTHDRGVIHRSRGPIIGKTDRIHAEEKKLEGVELKSGTSLTTAILLLCNVVQVILLINLVCKG